MVKVSFKPESQEWRAELIAGNHFKCHCGSNSGRVVEITQEERKDSAWAMHGIECAECGLRYAMEPRADIETDRKNRTTTFTSARLHPLHKAEYIDLQVMVNDGEQK